jgi:transposase-like protein
MNHFTRDLLEALSSPEKTKEIVREHLEEAMNAMLKNELDAVLGYQKYQRGQREGNSRNGSYERTYDTEYGEVNLNIPRDRKNEFEPHLFTPYQRRSDWLESMIIELYQKGSTTSEIAEIIEKLYGHYYSKETISNITEATQVLVEQFKSRPLKKRYSILYIDATFTKIRRRNVASEAVYLVLGIDEEGKRDILSYLILPEESSYCWNDLFTDIKKRGVEQVLLGVMDGLVGLDDAFLSHFPKADVQRCTIHFMRNIARRVRVSDRAAILRDLSDWFKSTTQEAIDEKRQEIILKWVKDYPKLMKDYMHRSNLFTFINYPSSIWGSIKTTNWIENTNKQIKRQMKKKEQFPNEQSAERFLVNQIVIHNEKLNSRIMKGFDAAYNQLQHLFDERYPTPSE